MIDHFERLARRNHLKPKYLANWPLFCRRFRACRRRRHGACILACNRRELTPPSARFFFLFRAANYPGASASGLFLSVLHNVL